MPLSHAGKSFYLIEQPQKHLHRFALRTERQVERERRTGRASRTPAGAGRGPRAERIAQTSGAGAIVDRLAEIRTTELAHSRDKR